MIQQRAYDSLKELCIMETLSRFTPVLVGTLPLNLNVSGSDLDILCCFEDQEEFYEYLSLNFSKHFRYFIIHSLSHYASLYVTQHDQPNYLYVHLVIDKKKLKWKYIIDVPTYMREVLM
ncbi:DUF4269 domain-containing protein [Paenibacillus terrae]|uniref:DUF4269 domain-containing protein n=1 Tax=Paenibacillus terrae TaxID=159743 RepID=UPI0039959E28